MNSRKAHVFVDGRSLCGRWGYLGTQYTPLALGDEPGDHDCKACWRKAKKETSQ